MTALKRQTGPIGPAGPPGPALTNRGRRYLAAAGALTGYWTPDTAALRITDHLSLRALIKPAAWASGASQTILSRWLTTGNQRSYQLQLNPTGQLLCQFSTLGTAATIVSIHSDDFYTNLVSDMPVWVWADMLANDGTGKSSVTFSYSYDLVTWTTINVATSTTPGPWFAGTANLFVVHAQVSATPFTGRIYRAEVYDNGVLAAAFDARGAADPPATFTDTTGKVWTPEASAVLAVDEVNDFDMIDRTESVSRLIPSPVSGLVVKSFGSRVGWGAGGSFGVSFADFAGYDPTGVVPCGAALQAAIDAVYAVVRGSERGGFVYLGSGLFTIELEIRLRNKVWLLGDGQTATQLVAQVGVFPTSTYMIRLGDGVVGNAFGSHPERLSIGLSDIAGSGGIYTNEGQEQSGAWDVLIKDFRDRGVWVDGTGATKPKNVSFRRMRTIGSALGFVEDFLIDSVPSVTLIEDVTAATSTYQGAASFHFKSSNVLLGGRNHVENAIDGVLVEGSGSHEVTIINLSGKNGTPANVTNLIRRAASAPDTVMTLVGIQRGTGAINTYTDDVTGETRTDAVIGLHAQHLALGRSITANRPSAASYGEGAAWYDRTLHKPVYSDGTNWRDAAGNVV